MKSGRVQGWLYEGTYYVYVDNRLLGITRIDKEYQDMLQYFEKLVIQGKFNDKEKR